MYGHFQYISLPAGLQQYLDELPDWSPTTHSIRDTREDAVHFPKECMIERDAVHKQKVGKLRQGKA